MPRSNKKKNPFKPPVKHPPLTSQSFCLPSPSQSNLMMQERNMMISRAISSGLQHGIELRHGRSNPGLGDCAFESTIQNINDRSCFRENFTLPINYYRRMWSTDMGNRTANTAWNIYSSQQEWLEGWQQMMVPCTYERGIFGDLMLPGIACGVRKYLLIINTNLQTPHDPIYVIDPREFDVAPDNETPVVLAYNMSHYESLHPCTETDISETTNLVKEYLENRYRFKRKDLPFLLNLESNNPKLSKDTSERKCKLNKKVEYQVSNLSKAKIQLNVMTSKTEEKFKENILESFNFKDLPNNTLKLKDISQVRGNVPEELEDNNPRSKKKNKLNKILDGDEINLQEREDFVENADKEMSKHIKEGILCI